MLARSGGRASELMATVKLRGTTAFRTFDLLLTLAVHLPRPQELQPDPSWGRAGYDYPGLEVAYSQPNVLLVER